MAKPTELTDAGLDKHGATCNETSSLSATIFSKFDDFRQTLKTALSSNSSEACMKEFDAGGGLEICESEKVTSLPVDFSGISEERRTELDSRATKLIEKYSTGETPDGDDDEELSFHDISDIMQDIAKMSDLTEVEKCRVWSDVHRHMQEDGVDISDADEYTSMIDSWTGNSDPWHALISMDDRYHAGSLINQSPEDASNAILDHENGGESDKLGFFRGMAWEGAKLVFGVNQGDINASEGQLSALRQLRSEGTFQAYADEWDYQFVRKDVDRYGNDVAQH